MNLYPISGSDSEWNKHRIVADRRIDKSVYYLIGKWFMHDKSKKALSYFDAILNREDIQSRMGPDCLVSFGLETKLMGVAILKAMIEQLNVRDDLKIRIDVKGTIAIWLKIINANQLCYASKYAHECATMFESIRNVSDDVKFWLDQISHVLYNFVFIVFINDFQMLADEAEAYFKRVDSDDTTDKTDRNPD